MFRKVLYTAYTLLLLQTAQCAGPPKVTGSYIAWGEMTQPIKELLGEEMQLAFEESYDADSKNSAFVVWMDGKNVTFIQDYKTNQAFKYIEGRECALTGEEDWLDSEYPPGLLTYEDDDGHVKFSLRQLFNLPDKYLVDSISNVQDIYRGVPARKWLYEIKGKDTAEVRQKLNIYAYWSDGTWETSSHEGQVPLGYVITKLTYNRTRVTAEEVVTSVFGFVSGTYERKYFEPYQGIVCANRVQTYKFPSVQNIKAISIHSEMILPDFQEIRYIDTYFDPRNQLVRIDVERLRDEDPIAEMKSKRYESEIAIGKMGVVFRQSVFKDGLKCDVIPFDKYLNDVQNFIDVKQDLKKWQMGKLFGLNDTSYVYTGQAIKGDIPCHVFQGIRKDWPEESANVTSLWEWCFNVNMSKEGDVVMFLNDEVGLINAQVTIISSDKPQDYPPGFRMFHHFYEVTAKDPDILDSTSFDISRCFGENLRRAVQFYVDYNITNDNRRMIENLTSDVSFLQKWKATLYKYTEIPSYSLRIAKLMATIIDNKLYIKFLILNDDPNRRVWNDENTAFDAERKFRDSVNKGDVSITFTLEKGQAPVYFVAAKHSVSPQIDPNFDHHTLAPPPPPKSTIGTPRTLFPFTLRTEPPHGSNSPTTDDGGSSVSSITGSGSTVSGITGSAGTRETHPTEQSTTPKDVQKRIKYTGHKPGAVAAISIAMILIGISIGSAGTFYKYYGFPSCSCSGLDTSTEPPRRKLTLDTSFMR